jgi:hypothetical protein
MFNIKTNSWSLLLMPLMGHGTHAVDTTLDPPLDVSLFTAPTQLDRLKLLPCDSQ